MDKKAKQPLLIWGAGGHALVVADIVQLIRKFEIAGYLDDVNPFPRASGISGAQVLGGCGQLKAIRRSGVRHAIVAIGPASARIERACLLLENGFELVTLVHPKAVVARDAILGRGTVVAAGAVINPGVQVGDNVILNTACIVDHGCRIESGAHVCPGVELGGDVSVGEESWIGIGTTVVEKTHIGPRTFVGAGSLVLHDLPEKVLAYGRPAVVIRRL